MDRRHLRTEDGVILPHFLCERHLLNRRRNNGPFNMLLFFYTDSSDERTDTDTGRAQGYLLHRSSDRCRSFRCLTGSHLPGLWLLRQTAAERVQLDQVQIVSCFYKVGGGIKPCMVHPLVIDTERTFNRSQLGNGILGEYRQPIGSDQIRDTVMDFRIDMVRRPARTIPRFPFSSIHFSVSSPLRMMSFLHRVHFQPGFSGRMADFFFRISGNSSTRRWVTVSSLVRARKGLWNRMLGSFNSSTLFLMFSA